MKKGSLYILIFLSLLSFVPGCRKEEPLQPAETPAEEPQERTDPQGGDADPEENPGEGQGGGQEPGGDGQGEDGGGQTDPPASFDPVLLEKGLEPTEFRPQVHYPDSLHTVAYDDFVNPLQDYLDYYDNVDYVVSKGNGTADPIITSEGWIRIYQGSSASKGGGYIRFRSKNGAKLERVTIVSATKTKVAYYLNEKISTRTKTEELSADTPYTVDNLENCTEVCICCMGTTSSERLTVRRVEVVYRGGFVDEDYYQASEEYGPLIGVCYPFTEDFDGGAYPTTEKPSYYKYGITAGPENLQWSTWFGSFSDQKPIGGGQSFQMRVYQEDPEYDGDQYGYGKMEYFLSDLKSVTFNYYFSEYWLKATVEYCEWGTAEWKNPQSIALEGYSERQTVKSFTYVLADGAPKSAKIRIRVDPSIGHPTKDHWDLYFDDFVFDGNSYKL